MLTLWCDVPNRGQKPLWMWPYLFRSAKTMAGSVSEVHAPNWHLISEPAPPRWRVPVCLLKVTSKYCIIVRRLSRIHFLLSTKTTALAAVGRHGESGLLLEFVFARHYSQRYAVLQSYYSHHCFSYILASLCCQVPSNPPQAFAGNG